MQQELDFAQHQNYILTNMLKSKQKENKDLKYELLQNHEQIS